MHLLLSGYQLRMCSGIVTAVFMSSYSKMAKLHMDLSHGCWYFPTMNYPGKHTTQMMFMNAYYSSAPNSKYQSSKKK